MSRASERLPRYGRMIVRQRGHAQLKHPTKPGHVTIPIHAGVTLNPRTPSTPLEQAGLSIARLPPPHARRSGRHRRAPDGRCDALALDWAALHYHHTAVAWIVYTLTGVVACGRLLVAGAR